MNLKPIGSGPFKFVEYKPQEYLILKRNENHFLKDRPYVDKIIIKYIKDSNNRIMVMERKEAHLQFAENAPQNLLRYKKAKHLSMTPDGYSAIGPINWVAFNLRREPLNNIKVRKAIAYAIDRDFIVQKIFFNLPQPANGPIVPGSPYHYDEVENYDLNLDKANALLDEAGYKKDAAGKRFSVTMDWETSMIQRMIAETVKSQLEKVGIEVNLRPSPDFPAWAKRVSSWDFDLTVDNVWNWGDPVIGVHRTYISTNIRHVIWSNTQGYSNPKVDELLALAGEEMDMAKRQALYADFSKIVVDELPVYWLFKTPFHTIYSNDLRNVVKSIWGVMAPMDTIYFEK
jgi:peptide/nickel transport system substrate-binding protein